MSTTIEKIKELSAVEAKKYAISNDQTICFMAGINFLMPIVKLLIEHRDELILIKKRSTYISKEFAKQEQEIYSEELNVELLKLLKDKKNE